jgi:hypothetical protein
MKEVIYRDNYLVNSKGEVFNIKTGRKLKPRTAGKGYTQLYLGAKYRAYVHRIVYDAFYGLKDGFVIDHINGVRDDNRLENLQQISQSENIRKGVRGKNDLPKYISKKKKNDVKTGFVYFYRATIEGKRKTLYSSYDLDSVISFKHSFEAI